MSDVQDAELNENEETQPSPSPSPSTEAPEAQNATAPSASPANAPAANAPIEEAQPAEALPEQNAPLPQLDTSAPANPGMPQQNAQNAQNVNEDKDTIDVIGNVPPAQNALQRDAENMLTQKDMADGHIAPKTYSDLFHDKGTIGKIGTLFGLMLSGAGSGLSHQPNALMEMMNNQINRDLEAQKTNQANKVNWYNSAAQHETNLARIAQENAMTNKINMGTYTEGLDNDVKKWNMQYLPGLVDMSASTTARNNMRNSQVQIQQDAVNKLAPGLAKDRAQMVVDNMRKSTLLANAQDNAQFAQKKAALLSMHPNPLNSNHPASLENRILNPVSQDVVSQAIDRGKWAPNAPSKMVILPGEVPTANQEMTNLKYNRNNYSDWMQRFKRLEGMKFAGQVPAASLVGSVGSKIVTGLGTVIGGLLGGPAGAAAGAVGGSGVGNAITEHASGAFQDTFERERNTLINELMDRVGVNRSEGAKANLINSMFPSWNDTASSTKSAWDAGKAYFRGQQSEAAPTLRRIGAVTDLPDIPYSPLAKPKKEKSEK